MPPIERAAHLALGRDDFLGLRDDLVDERARNDHDAVAVAEQLVAGRDASPSPIVTGSP